MLVDGGWDPEMFFEPVPKCSASLSKILLRTVNSWVLVFVYDPAATNMGPNSEEHSSLST